MICWTKYKLNLFYSYLKRNRITSFCCIKFIQIIKYDYIFILNIVHKIPVFYFITHLFYNFLIYFIFFYYQNDNSLAILLYVAVHKLHDSGELRISLLQTTGTSWESQFFPHTGAVVVVSH